MGKKSLGATKTPATKTAVDSTNPNSGRNKRVDLATHKGKGSYKAGPPKTTF